MRVVIVPAEVHAGMNLDDVAGTHTRRGGPAPVTAQSRDVVRLQESEKRRLLRRSLETGRIDMKHTAIAGGFRFGARADAQGLHSLAAHSIRIGERQPDLVWRIFLEVEQAAGKLVGQGEV